MPFHGAGLNCNESNKEFIQKLGTGKRLKGLVITKDQEHLHAVRPIHWPWRYYNKAPTQVQHQSGQI